MFRWVHIRVGLPLKIFLCLICAWCLNRCTWMINTELTLILEIIQKRYAACMFLFLSIWYDVCGALFTNWWVTHASSGIEPVTSPLSCIVSFKGQLSNIWVLSLLDSFSHCYTFLSFYINMFSSYSFGKNLKRFINYHQSIYSAGKWIRIDSRTSLGFLVH